MIKIKRHALYKREGELAHWELFEVFDDIDAAESKCAELVAGGMDPLNVKIFSLAECGAI